jgi:predicted transcriptional regulator
MNQIKTEAKKRGLTGKKVAKWIHVSEGMVTKYYKAESDMPAIKFIELAKLVYQEQEDVAKKCILEFIKKTVRTDNLQELLEWAANSGDCDYIEKVQARIINSSLIKDSLIYQMIRERNMKQITPSEFYLKIEDFKISENLLFDSKILLKIATLYAQLDLKSYSVVIPLANNIMEDLDAISSDYLQQSFRVRTLEVLAYAYLKLGQIEEVEKIAEEFCCPEIVDRFPLPCNSLIRIVAEANLFENPAKSIVLIEEAINMLKRKKLTSHSMRVSALEATHDFIKIYNNHLDGLYLNDLSEKAHYFAQKGKKDEALIILEEIEKRNKQLSAHQYYYKALATNEKRYYLKSLNEFIRQGDSFYTQLINVKLITNYA